MTSIKISYASDRKKHIRTATRFGTEAFCPDIRRKLPVDPIQKLQTQLDLPSNRSVTEDAAKIRDEIQRKSDGA